MWHQDTCSRTKPCYKVWSHRKRFLGLAVTVKGPLACHPKGECFHLQFHTSLLQLGLWSLKWWHGGHWQLWPRRLGQRCCLITGLCLFVLWCRWERRAFLTCAVADAVVLGCEAFHFFMAFITFLFFYPPLASRSSERKSRCPEDLVVWLVCAWFVQGAAELGGGKWVTMTCSSETFYSEER